jgi:hypothetical protein
VNNYEYKLWKPTIDSSDVRFLHVDDLPNSGFISVYSYSKNDAENMQQLGSYKRFKGSVWSEALFIDCDTEEASQNVERWLKTQGVGYEKYSTGNRGHHYYVNRTASPSHVLPMLDKQFVEKTFKGADLSIYHHVAMYRQVGATHKKTGSKKVLLYRVAGDASLDFTKAEELSEAVNEEYSYSDSSTNNEMQSVFTDRALKNMTVPIAKGERRARYIEIGLALHRLGQPIDFAMAYLANVNLMAEEMLSDKELERILDWVYNKR